MIKSVKALWNKSNPQQDTFNSNSSSYGNVNFTDLREALTYQ